MVKENKNRKVNKMEITKKNQMKEFVGDYTHITFGCGSDRYPYEIVGITTDNKQLIIRRMDSVRIDNNGMSESQDYERKSNPSYELEYLRLYIPRKKYRNGDTRPPALVSSRLRGPVKWYHQTYGLCYTPSRYYDYSF